ncbi:MAG: porphobilinogen synthase [Bacteroidota bacterium]
MNLPRRPRRLRTTAAVRAMVEETRLLATDLLYPLFVIGGEGIKSEIKSMPGMFRLSQEHLLEEIDHARSLGVKAFALFPNIHDSLKDARATESLNPEGVYLKAITAIKANFPDVAVMTDVAMDPYSSDGHDGYVENGRILNDETLPILADMAVAQARAGADIIGPSDMMDGRIGYIRTALDEAGFTDVSIMAYTAKYAGAFYGPFRDALDSAPKFGDKKTYQMNPSNVREALVEAELDYNEGADFLMVKPAMLYLDVIKTLKDNFNIPIAAYNVSGEYAMVKAAARMGWLDEKRAMAEILTAMKRAGADIILTYFAADMARMLKEG